MPERIYEPEDKLNILHDCLKRWVEMELITEVELLEIYSEVGVALFEEQSFDV